MFPSPQSPGTRVAEPGEAASCPVLSCMEPSTCPVPVTEGLLPYLRPQWLTGSSAGRGPCSHHTGPTKEAASAPLQGRGPGRPVSAEAWSRAGCCVGRTVWSLWDASVRLGVAAGGRGARCSRHLPRPAPETTHRREPSLPASRGTASKGR